MVHKGFWQSWSSKGVRDRVLDTVAQIMASQGKLAHSMEVLVTGKHPLLQLPYIGLRGLAADPRAGCIKYDLLTFRGDILSV